MHDDAQRPAGPHGDRRLHIEIALDEALAGAVGGRLRGELQRPNQIAVARAESELAADAEHGGECDALQELPGMQIDLVGKAGIAAGIRRREIVDHHRAAVGPDDALPDDEGAFLPEGDDVVILADQARSLWDEEEAAGHRVENVLRHVRDDNPGKIGVEAADQARGDDGAGHQLVG